jgi:hypothetical protein
MHFFFPYFFFFPVSRVGTKKMLFGGDADKMSKGKKAHLAIIYKANGETFRHTFKDEDFVDLKTTV